MPHAHANPTFSEYLTVGEAAKFLGVSPWTLRNWDKSGKLRPHRHPKNSYRIYLQTDLDAVLALEPTAAPKPDWHHVEDRAHVVQFYESDAFLAESVAAYVAGALESAADTAIVVAAEPRRDAVHRALESRGIDVPAALASG